MHPTLRIVAQKPPKRFCLQFLFELTLEPRAQSVRKNEIGVHIGIQNRFVIYAQPLDNFEPLQVLLTNEFTFFVVFFDERLKLLHLFVLGAHQRETTCYLIGGVRDEHIKHVAHRRAVHIMPEVLYPPHGAVFAQNTVFHIIELVLIVRYLLVYARFHPFYIVRMHHARKRISCKFLELGKRPATENAQQRFIDEQDLFGIVSVYKKSAGDLVYKLFEFRREIGAMQNTRFARNGIAPRRIVAATSVKE